GGRGGLGQAVEIEGCFWTDPAVDEPAHHVVVDPVGSTDLGRAIDGEGGHGDVRTPATFGAWRLDPGPVSQGPAVADLGEEERGVAILLMPIFPHASIVTGARRVAKWKQAASNPRERRGIRRGRGAA